MEIGDSHVPPGFRFHPTEEELVGYYLRRKINSLKIDLDVIVEIDLYKIEPWDIEDKCKYGYEDQSEWYFFSHKDKKYPTGTRTNRATTAGFWKATGRDKAILSKDEIIGMRKTLVFYKGRAPNGKKSDWIMHEYRLQTSLNAPPQEEGWVVCRAFKKPSPSTQRPYYAHNPYMTCAHMMTPAASPPPLPALIDPNYAHSAATIATFHRHPPPPPHTDVHQQHRRQYDQLQCDYPSLVDNQQGLFREDHFYDEWKLSDVFLASDHIMEQSSSSSFDPSSGHGGYM